MLLTSKEISERIHQKMAEKYPLQFKNVKRLDIQRVLDYYGFVMYRILIRGGYLTLSTYVNHKTDRCIRILPNERNVVYKQYGDKNKQRNAIIQYNRKKRADL